MEEKSFALKLIGSCINGVSYLSEHQAVRLAYFLFQRPPRRKISTSEQNYLTNAKIDIPDGVEGINYYKWGEGNKVILFLHGWKSSSARWRHYIKRLDLKEYTVIAVDAPNHGLSPANVFNLYQYSLAVKPLLDVYSPDVIIGHSMGGFTAMVIGNITNVRPSKYILLAPNEQMKPIIGTFIDLLGIKPSLLPKFYDYVGVLTPYSIDFFDSNRLLDNIEAQVQIIHDTHDDILPYEGSKRLAKKQHVNLITTNGMGHSLKNDFIYDKVIEIITE